MTVHSAGRETAPRRREAARGTALALLLATGVTVVGLAAGPGDGARPSATPASVSAPPATTPAPASAPSAGVPAEGTQSPPPAVPQPAREPVTADELPPALPAVAFDAPAAGDDGVRAEVVALAAVDGSGTGPGNVAGPALRVTVQLTGGTGGPVALDLVSVTLTHGADQTPASPLDDPSADPFTGSLEPGTTAEGTYVFTVPEDDRDLVTLSVGYRADASTLVFNGSAP